MAGCPGLRDKACDYPHRASTQPTPPPVLLVTTLTDDTPPTTLQPKYALPPTMTTTAIGDDGSSYVIGQARQSQSRVIEWTNEL
ncbi:hypothetical protein D9611_009806 [Ephemerocybe angulata]|uniref:Uncharacterized protein n=1 Tax=Ephemerocybe angulata TaxID=980116 RepID=A0A8H5CE80_9AGAR|nr:hypothetical protein D9611_009806 [Tulosesus angulatus]